MAEARLDYDVMVIGGGPAGYPAAIRAAQNGLKVACVDAWRNRDGSSALGGTCLNAGCIPSKAMLESSELWHRAQHEFSAHGIKVGSLTLDLATMQKRRAAIVRGMTGGIASLFKAAGVTAIYGKGRLLARREVEVTAADGQVSRLAARHVVLASGSVPSELKALPFDGANIIDSWSALELDTVPRRLCVIGAGVIGLELGSVWRRLGAEVVTLEALDALLPMADAQLATEAGRHFKKLGLDIRLGAKVSAAVPGKDGVSVRYADARGEQSLLADKVVVAVGRRPYTEGLLDAASGVTLDERGFIGVDEHCATGVENVWAVGDVVRGPMLAHKGKEEGIAVADRIAGKYAHVNYELIPSVIYTAPEIAWAGKTEAQAKEAGIECKAGVFPFAASGRAKAMESTAGFVKLIANRVTDEILGVHIIGPMAGELIAEAVLAMEFRGSAEDLQRTIHAHPTLAEAVHEAALAADKRAIDNINR
ncbi:MAG TPA: dihydrolipoyl dehydrogenase [Steroidobacteraceae bacterium]|nr:dihydrolipoyl dehydrogenase [Steroidobacteraceae bacterium]